MVRSQVSKKRSRRAADAKITRARLSGSPALKEAERRIAEAAKGRGNVLQLSDLHLNHLPPSIVALTHLDTLNVSGCGLRGMPQSLSRLSRLRTLWAGDNKFSEFPKSISKLTNLKGLNLSNNGLTVLPEGLQTLTQLEYLSVWGNTLKVLPQWVGALARLTRLDVSYNELTSLPKSLASLTHLIDLDANSNKLKRLPEWVGNLGNLQTLNLTNNQLTSLPRSLQRLDKLTALFLHRNARLGLPDAVLGPRWSEVKGDQRASPPRDILRIFFSRLDVGERPLNEVKLLIVGRGESGKTSLVKTMILGQPFDPSERESPGIAIAPWKLVCGKDEVTVHVWDFAGQEITHETHRFFLTDRSLYLVVLDGRRGTQEEDADYWLSHVQKYGQGSPAIVALNKWHSPGGFDLERVRLKRTYPFIKRFVETDCATPFGLRELKAAIQEAIASAEMDAVRTKFPIPWFTLKERISDLRERRKHFLSFPEYAQLCKESLVTEAHDQESLARILNRLGVALYYGDNPRLRDTRVLVPDWVANGVYALLQGLRLRGDQAPGPGMLPARSISDVLGQGLRLMKGTDPSAYPANSAVNAPQFLVDLMVDRELCFEAAGDDGASVYLVPELLSGDEPANFSVDDFIQKAKASFRYRYDLLPNGVISRFIVRTHPLSENQPRWKRGVVLVWEQARALILSDKRDRMVKVYLRGGTAKARQRLAGIIRSNLKTIHDELPRELKVREELLLGGDRWTDVETLLGFERSGAHLSVLANDGVIEDLNPSKELQVIQPASARAPDAPRLRVFISYAHSDHKYLENFRQNLAVLKNAGLIESWGDWEIRGGEDWDQTIRDELRQAEIVVLLLSTPFLASKYIQGQEVKLALERRKEGKAQIVPVLVENCGWEGHAQLSKLQIVPNEKGKLKTIVGFKPNQRAGWSSVENALKKVITQIAKRLPKTVDPRPDLQPRSVRPRSAR
jgi:internalin A